MYSTNDYRDYLEHSWGKKPEQKAAEKAYNAKYYREHKNKWKEYLRNKLGVGMEDEINDLQDEASEHLNNARREDVNARNAQARSEFLNNSIQTERNKYINNRKNTMNYWKQLRDSDPKSFYQLPDGVYVENFWSGEKGDRNLKISDKRWDSAKKMYESRNKYFNNLSSAKRSQKQVSVHESKATAERQKASAASRKADKLIEQYNKTPLGKLKNSDSKIVRAGANFIDNLLKDKRK